MPTGHNLQEVAPSEVSPAGHNLQEVAPVVSEIVPAGHKLQVVAPVAEYVPAEQFKHVEAPEVE